MNLFRQINAGRQLQGSLRKTIQKLYFRASCCQLEPQHIMLRTSKCDMPHVTTVHIKKSRKSLYSQSTWPKRMWRSENERYKQLQGSTTLLPSLKTSSQNCNDSTVLGDRQTPITWRIAFCHRCLRNPKDCFNMLQLQSLKASWLSPEFRRSSDAQQPLHLQRWVQPCRWAFKLSSSRERTVRKQAKGLNPPMFWCELG